MSVGTCMLTRKKTGENRKFPNISDLLLLSTKYSYQNILDVNSSNWYTFHGIGDFHPIVNVVIYRPVQMQTLPSLI